MKSVFSAIFFHPDSYSTVLTITQLSESHSITVLTMKFNNYSCAILWIIFRFFTVSPLAVDAFAGVNVQSTKRQTKEHRYVPKFMATRQEFGNAWPAMAPLKRYQPSTRRGKIMIRAYTLLRAAFLYKMLKFPFWEAVVVYCYSNAHTEPDVKRIEASKLACEKSIMISGTTGKLEASDEARKWRFVVWQRIVFQAYGLFRVLVARNSDQLFPGLSIILLSRFVYSLQGGESRLYHDADGKLKPRSSGTIQAHRTKTLIQAIVLVMAPSWDISGAWKAFLVLTALDASANNQPPMAATISTAGSTNISDLMEEIMKKAEQQQKNRLVSDNDVQFPEISNDED